MLKPIPATHRRSSKHRFETDAASHAAKGLTRTKHGTDEEHRGCAHTRIGWIISLVMPVLTGLKRGWPA